MQAVSRMSVATDDCRTRCSDSVSLIGGFFSGRTSRMPPCSPIFTLPRFAVISATEPNMPPSERTSALFMISSRYFRFSPSAASMVGISFVASLAAAAATAVVSKRSCSCAIGRRSGPMTPSTSNAAMSRFASVRTSSARAIAGAASATASRSICPSLGRNVSRRTLSATSTMPGSASSVTWSISRAAVRTTSMFFPTIGICAPSHQTGPSVLFAARDVSSSRRRVSPGRHRRRRGRCRRQDLGDPIGL